MVSAAGTRFENLMVSHLPKVRLRAWGLTLDGVDSKNRVQSRNYALPGSASGRHRTA